MRHGFVSSNLTLIDTFVYAMFSMNRVEADCQNPNSTLIPPLFDKGTKYYSLVNILLVALSIFIDLFYQSTVHLEFGPMCVPCPPPSINGKP